MPPLFPLTLDWAIGSDDKQWTLLRRRNRQDDGYWQAVSYVASTKAVLLRILRENGVVPTPRALVDLNGLPERFSDWRHRCSDTPKTKQPLAATSGCNEFNAHPSLKENAHG